MKTSDDLFQLIASLNRSEKRYFKLFATRNSKSGDNKFLTLFDAYDKMEEYDESKLHKRLKRESFFNHISSTKHHLQNLILKSLYAYHAGKSLNAELGELIETVKIAFNRGLYDLCRKLLVRAKSMAVDNEKFLALLLLLNEERRLSINWQTRDLDAALSRISAEERAIVAKISNEAEFAHLFTQTIALRKVQMRVRTPEESERINAVLGHTLLRDETSALTFRAKVDFFTIHGTAAILNGDHERAHAYYTRLIEHWHQRPEFIQSDMDRYKTEMMNFINSCLKVERFDQIEPALAKIKALPHISLKDQVRLFQYIHSIELLYCLHYGLFEQGRALIGDIERGLKQFATALTPAAVLTFYHNISIFYFFSGDYLRTLDWLECIRDRANTEVRQDIQDFARILLPVIQYEIGNHDVAEYQIRSAYRYLQRRKKLYEYERKMLSNLTKLIKAIDGSALQQALAAFSDDLAAIDVSSGSEKTVGLTEIQFWVESKINRISITEIFMRKIAERDAELEANELDDAPEQSISIP